MSKLETSYAALLAERDRLLDEVESYKRIARVQDEKAHHWLERIMPLEAERDKYKKQAEDLWLALALIKNHGSHDHAVLKQLAAEALA